MAQTAERGKFDDVLFAGGSGVRKMDRHVMFEPFDRLQSRRSPASDHPPGCPAANAVFCPAVAST